MLAERTRVTPITQAPSALRAVERRRSGDRLAVLLLLPVAMLLIVGLGAVLSSSSVVAIREGVDQWFYVKRQAVWIVLGILALVVAIRVPYRWYARVAAPLLGVAILGLFATLVIGDVRGGSRRWIELGPITLQASEFAKFAEVVFLASVLAKKEKYLSDFPHVFWPVAGSLGIIGALLLAEPDLGTAILIVATAFAILTVSAAPMRYIFGLGVLSVTGAAALAYAQPYRWARVTGFLNPEADPLGTGLQPLQSLVALGTGGWFGVGLGASRARWSFLPNAHTDFIFAIIAEEVGFAGAIVIVALFAMFAIIGLVIAYRASDTFGRLLAVGIVAWLSIQALINIGGVAVVLPITGVPLPFVSSGGSAMVMNLAAVGVLVNITNARTRATAS
jgi:cell division protein FtsW